MSTLLHRVAVTRRVAKVRDRDPWITKLQDLRGEIGSDGIERIATRTIMDMLNLPPSQRSNRSAGKLARVMNDLGWHRTMARGLNRGGYRTNMRGYARDARIAA